MPLFMSLLGYFWPFRQYRNAAAGSELERAAAYRYNRQLARGLPAYLNRWAAVTCLLLTASAVAPSWLSAVAGTAFTLAFCMTAHIAHVYLLFSRR
jgi:hypothetical protein